MHRDLIMEKVIQAVQQVQEVSGRAAGEIHSGTKPVEETDGFDSMSGLEAAVALSESLGRDIPDDNLFVSSDGRRALSIAEVADNLSNILNGETAAI